MMTSVGFAGQGRQLQAGTVVAQIHVVTTDLTGAMAPSGVVTVILEPSLFSATGLGGYIEGPLSATLRTLIFVARHLVTPSTKRTTIIAGEDRLTVIAGEDRLTIVKGEDRIAVIKGEDRAITVPGESRLTVIESAETLISISE